LIDLLDQELEDMCLMEKERSPKSIETQVFIDFSRGTSMIPQKLNTNHIAKPVRMGCESLCT
jgi:hypothetical protein